LIAGKNAWLSLLHALFHFFFLVVLQHVLGVNSWLVSEPMVESYAKQRWRLHWMKYSSIHFPVNIKALFVLLCF